MNQFRSPGHIVNPNDLRSSLEQKGSDNNEMQSDNKMTFKGERGRFSVHNDNEVFNVGTVVNKCGTDELFDVQFEDPIRWRTNEKNHSPTGFEWGYSGSGPAQLAWCLLRECGLTQEQTQTVYMRFKAEVVAKFSQEFTITKEEILNWVSKAA
jgi:hypothetical protein